MIKKLLLLPIILALLIPITIFAHTTVVSWDDFCIIKDNDFETTSADFICQLDIFEMNDRITDLEDRVTEPEQEPIHELGFTAALDYRYGHKMIVIKGYMPNLNATFASLQIINTDGVRVLYDRMNVDFDGSFVSINSASRSWVGNYTIDVAYYDNVITQIFEFN